MSTILLCCNNPWRIVLVSPDDLARYRTRSIPRLVTAIKRRPPGNELSPAVLCRGARGSSHLSEGQPAGGINIRLSALVAKPNDLRGELDGARSRGFMPGRANRFTAE
ncbi:hypothetical protein PoB_004106400 [Plakobranchus ocellatus]|uniref:Uncharacterized protein n=1 Tax=Plakobranchus ocellatus TaxID=259542 RepID=A0AAV4B763_9GAST|nr:hypothetical protein PoB_004106400 [Plakobranchus ocellatus]